MKKSKGFTLVELLAALAIGVVIVVILSGVFLSGNLINNENLKRTSIQNEYVQIYDKFNSLFSQDNILNILQNPKKGCITYNTNQRVTLYFEVNPLDGESYYIGSIKENGFVNIYKFFSAQQVAKQGENNGNILKYSRKEEIITNKITNLNYKYMLNDKLISFSGAIKYRDLNRNFDFLFKMDTQNISFKTIEIH